MCDLEAIGVPSIFKTIRSDVSLTRMLSTLDFTRMTPGPRTFFVIVSFEKNKIEHSVIRTTSVQDLNPRTCTDNAHESVLTHEMVTIEPDENPSRTLTWKPLVFVPTSNVVLMMTVFLPLNGILFCDPDLVCPLRL